MIQKYESFECEECRYTFPLSRQADTDSGVKCTDCTGDFNA